MWERIRRKKNRHSQDLENNSQELEKHSQESQDLEEHSENLEEEALSSSHLPVITLIIQVPEKHKNQLLTIPIMFQKMAICLRLNLRLSYSIAALKSRKGRNVVLQNKYGPTKIVNDGEAVLKECFDGISNSTRGPSRERRHESYTDITRDAKNCRCCGSRTLMSREVEDHELSDVISADSTRGPSRERRCETRKTSCAKTIDIAGNRIYYVLSPLRKGIVQEIVEGMQFDRGYLSKYLTFEVKWTNAS
nr:hypothetical protein [Tanacetum cinerariifolium]